MCWPTCSHKGHHYSEHVPAAVTHEFRIAQRHIQQTSTVGEPTPICHASLHQGMPTRTTVTCLSAQPCRSHIVRIHTVHTHSLQRCNRQAAYLTELYSGERHISRLSFQRQVRNCCSHPRAYVDSKRSGALPGAGVPSSSASASARLLAFALLRARIVSQIGRTGRACESSVLASECWQQNPWKRLAHLPAAAAGGCWPQGQPHHYSAATDRLDTMVLPLYTCLYRSLASYASAKSWSRRRSIASVVTSSTC
jgi:hypothetical protein